MVGESDKNDVLIPNLAEISQRNNLDQYFKGQQKDEELICFFRHHWITLVKDLFIFLVLIGILIIAVIFGPQAKSALPDNTILKIVFTFGMTLEWFFLHRFFVVMTNHFVNIGLVTDMRLIDHHKTLFFKDSLEAVDLMQIQDLEQIVEGFLPNLLGYGDIKIFLSASSAVMYFPRMPNVKFHFRCISRQKEARRLMVLESERKGQPIPIPTTPPVSTPVPPSVQPTDFIPPFHALHHDEDREAPR